MQWFVDVIADVKGHFDWQVCESNRRARLAASEEVPVHVQDMAVSGRDHRFTRQDFHRCHALACTQFPQPLHHQLTQVLCPHQLSLLSHLRHLSCYTWSG